MTTPRLSPVRVRVNKDGTAAQLLVGAKADRMVPTTSEHFNEQMLQAIRAAGAGQTIECSPIMNPTTNNVVPAPIPVAPAPHPPNPQLAAGPQPNPQSPLDNNPYNFAEWEGDSPWSSPEPHLQGAQHDHWCPERISGTITLNLEACSPIFVPEGTLLDAADRRVRRFWRCGVDQQGQPRYAIPGSSVKGVIRTLVETLTNSALTIVNEADYSEPIAYRRRSADLWVITGIAAHGGLQLERHEARFAYQDAAGVWRYRGNLAPTAPPTRDIPLRANLLWTPAHTHSWTTLRTRPTGIMATVPPDRVARYRAYIDKSLAIKSHRKRVRDLDGAHMPHNYLSLPAEERDAVFEGRKRDLKLLSVGDYVFGIPEDDTMPSTVARTLACFGKNVNFMWADEKSPRDLAGNFYPKDEQALTLADADIAHATFGFAGSYRHNGHPFRGRVRFGTFWAQGQPQDLGEVQLKPLTAPTGVKLKARSLYLPPGRNGKMQTYSEAKSLRGRKRYWQQRAQDRAVDAEHKVGPDDGAGNNQLPPPIKPLASGTRFAGAVHFDNLTKIELGALLAALCPDLLFGPGHGWNIGKAKPRGLGSVHPTLKLRLRKAPNDGFASPFAGPLCELPQDELDGLIKAFTDWLDLNARSLYGNGSSRRSLGFFQDLKRLLQLPNSRYVKQYPPIPVIAGPLPQFESPTGVPNLGQRINAMKRARDIH